MKKLCKVLRVIAIGAVIAVGPAGIPAFAQTGLFFGGELGLGIGFNGLGKDFKTMKNSAAAMGISLDEKSLLAFGLAGETGYGITDRFAILSGLSLSFGQGIELSAAGVSIKATTNFADIPVLVRYLFLNSPLLLGVQGGIHLGIPFGIEVESSIPFFSSSKPDADGVVFGMSAGLIAGYPLGPGRIIGDLRFLMDFNPVKGKLSGQSMEGFTRRNFLIMVGYEYVLRSK
ncbi:MAG: hypothetical protein LBC88_08720 [Spirochaetaceae bacterium]|jgi:hypothetical protein|nr:hypothetical protein [Spirochaetaceae bacterium]